MFANQSQAFKMAERFAAQQRAKEIAMTGKSKIKVNNNKSKKFNTPKSLPKRMLSTKTSARSNTSSTLPDPICSSVESISDSGLSSLADCVVTDSSGAHQDGGRKSTYFEANRKIKFEAAFARLDEAIEGQKGRLYEKAHTIDRSVLKAKGRLEGFTGNNLGAYLAMKNVKKYQAEYLGVLKVIAGLKELRLSIEDEHVKPHDVARSINEVLSVRRTKRDAGNNTKEVLLEELRKGTAFYPSLNGQSTATVVLPS